MTHRLLVVDDDPAIRRMLMLVLELEGYQVETATDGFDALSKIGSAQPDLLLLDLRMPGLDGIELLGRVTRLPVVPPSIVVSGEVERRAEARHAGAVGFVPKPFDLDRLLHAVASVLAETDMVA